MKPKGTRELRGTITVAEVKMLKEALKSARMEECCFSEATKNEIRPYMNSWIANPLQRVLTALEHRHAIKKNSETYHE